MRLYGKRPVMERILRAPRTVRALYLQTETDAPEVVRAAKAAGLSFISKSKAEFTRMAGLAHAQGVLAEVEDFRYAELEDLLKRPEPRPTLLLLDRITDPQNLGAILRTVACLGGFALVLPRHDSAEVNETVLRVACGGENHVPVARVTNLAQAAELAKKAGYWVAGASAEGGTPLHQADWPTPLAVVLGSEGGGIRPGLEKHLELTLTLPMPGAALSYNVATAAALIAYEITRRRLAKPAPGAHA
ncbi:MAG: 23S rRNA (guanosine(2251)-2'-O)-methyltransferase RlmB [Candidatus Omnitrophica bacterium]|nr:23S rRNA (guanosine(2251)-2'-O)-methyltransferase RlmB [Candidatus Omnitrophota bacterium]